jgi:exonuclease VII large subunit
LWQNTIDIAKGICYMQVPVIVAIGHTSDKSILDHICRFSCKTPTDAAYVLIKSYQQYQQELESLRESIQTQCNQQTNTINNNINILYQTIEQTIKQKFCTLNNMCQERYQTIQQFVPHHLLKR